MPRPCMLAFSLPSPSEWLGKSVKSSSAKTSAPFSSGVELWGQPNNTSSNIGTLFLNKDLSDVSLRVPRRCGGHDTYPAHRTVLASCSPHWKKLLSMSPGKGAAPVVELNQVYSDTLVEMLRFIYTANVQLSPVNVVPLIFTAKQFQIDALLSTCKAYVAYNPRLDVCTHVIDMPCGDDDVHELKCLCRKIVLENGSQLARSPELFSAMTQATLASLLEDTLLDADEIELFCMVKDWCAAHARDKTDTEEMRQLYAPYEDLIRYPLIDMQRLQTVVRASGLVKERLLLDAWEMARGLKMDAHSAWNVPRTRRLTWQISWKDVKSHGGEYVTSVQCTRGFSVQLMLHPGTFEDAKGYLSVHLGLSYDRATTTQGILTSYSITLPNQVAAQFNASGKVNNRILRNGQFYGFPHFIKLRKLEVTCGRPSPFLDNDVLQLHVVLDSIELIDLPINEAQD